MQDIKNTYKPPKTPLKKGNNSDIFEKTLGSPVISEISLPDISNINVKSTIKAFETHFSPDPSFVNQLPIPMQNVIKKKQQLNETVSSLDSQILDFYGNAVPNPILNPLTTPVRRNNDGPTEIEKYRDSIPESKLSAKLNYQKFHPRNPYIAKKPREKSKAPLKNANRDYVA